MSAMPIKPWRRFIILIQGEMKLTKRKSRSPPCGKPSGNSIMVSTPTINLNHRPYPNNRGASDFHRGEMPNIIRVFPNGPVARKFAQASGIQDRPPRPLGRVTISLIGASLRGAIAAIISEQ